MGNLSYQFPKIENDQEKVKNNQVIVKTLIFDSSVDQNLIKNQSIASILKLNHWGIYSGNYQKHKWNEAFQHMMQCSAFTIILYCNQHPQILKQIQNIFFINLEELSLAINKINNIQALCKINFMNLKSLNLRNNRISRINCLIKFHANNLDQLNLEGNPLISIDCFNKSKVSSQKFIKLVLQCVSYYKPAHEDLSILVKLSPEQVQKIDVKSKQRIGQTKIHTILKSRFSQDIFQII